MIGHFTDSFAWRQAAQCSRLFQFAVGPGPCLLDQRIPVNIMFLLSISTQGSENGFIQLADTHYTQLTLFSLHIEVFLLSFNMRRKWKGRMFIPRERWHHSPKLTLCHQKPSLSNAEELLFGLLHFLAVKGVDFLMIGHVYQTDIRMCVTSLWHFSLKQRLHCL